MPFTNYVVNATGTIKAKTSRGPFNRRHQNTPHGFSYCRPDAFNLDTTPSLNWVSIDTRGYTGPFAWRFSQVIDGLSNTLMMSEANFLSPESAAGASDPRGTWPYLFFDARLTPNSAFDVMASWFSPPSYAGCVNSPPSLPCQATGGQDWIFAARSRHSGGVQAVMCDGSVRFVSDQVNHSAWQAQGTMNGREPLTLDQ